MLSLSLEGVIVAPARETPELFLARFQSRTRAIRSRSRDGGGARRLSREPRRDEGARAPQSTSLYSSQPRCRLLPAGAQPPLAAFASLRYLPAANDRRATPTLPAQRRSAPRPGLRHCADLYPARWKQTNPFWRR